MVGKKRKKRAQVKTKKKLRMPERIDARERDETVEHKTRKDSVNMEQDGSLHQSDATNSAAVSKPIELLAAELVLEMGEDDAGGALVLPGRREKKQKRDTIPDDLLQQAQRMSKSKRKKLEAIAARKVKEARRAELYKSLETKQLSQDQMKLMYSTSKMGHKETLRERLKRSMNRKKAGIQLSQDEMNELIKRNERKYDDKEEGEKGDREPAKSEELANIKKEQALQTNEATAVRVDAAGVNENGQLAPRKGAANEKSGKKKRRKKLQSGASRCVPMLPTKDDFREDSGIDAVSSIPSVQQEAIEEQGLAPSASSQSAAMSKLEALRKKNEAKRRQKAQAAATSQAETAVTIENEPSTDSANVYVPKPIVMKTAEELRELSKTTKLSLKSSLVKLSRKPEIQLARMQLPVCSSEQEIMEAITENDVVILCGETGSGKTTQVPQFLYEAGYGHPDHPTRSGRIGVTQPRRVAAISTAKRVAEELNVPFDAPNGHVGYQIRYDAEHVSEHTRIKFMTDGILLKEIQQDFLLRPYSIILLDEAHERNVNTDILTGLLSRIAPLRAQMAQEEEHEYELLSTEEKATPHKRLKPLKLVIMSATLRVEDFTQNTRLFPHPPPVLRVEARQYPVTIYFNKRTELENYVDEAYKKVVKIHKKLPGGGVLVFLTGQREILQLCRKLTRVYSVTAVENAAARKSSRAFIRAQRREPSTVARTTDHVLHEHDDVEEEADLEDIQVYGHEVDEEDATYELEQESELGADDEDDIKEEGVVPYMHVLPLYSLLPNEEQMKVFEPVPANHRLIVVATNVAETSLTIPGIKYVVDAGRTKERVFDLASGISSFRVQWISKASADQRAGRAGRTGPGHCYRLYSSAVYDTEFPPFSSPEILCQPIADLVLQMKAMGIHHVLHFPFPTPPERQAVKNALTTLIHLGAISPGDDESITGLGRALVTFPVAARFAKMLLLAQKLHVVEYTIAIVAALSGHSPFMKAAEPEDPPVARGQDATSGNGNKPSEMEEMENEWQKAEARRRDVQWIDHESDVLSLLRAAGAYAYTGGSRAFCRANNLHEKTMQNMFKLRQQLTRIINQRNAERDGARAVVLTPKMPPPDLETQCILRQIIAAGFLDHVAKRVPAGTITSGTKIERTCAYMTATGSVQEAVYIHPHSAVFTPHPRKLPEFVVYQHIMRTTRAYMKIVTAIEPEWLASIGKETPLCKFAPPLTEPAPFYNAEADEVQCYAKAQYGVHLWPLPVMRIAYPEEDHGRKNECANKFRWFAKCLLDGHVVPSLLPFATVLKEPSATLIRKKFDKKIQLLVAKLQQKRVASRRALVTEWSRPRGHCFLKTELQNWIQDAHQAAFDQAWSSIVTAAVQRETKSE
ncbi:hypothetical protein PsorP6_012060 [Peronosclerospora sorghi]|uniref:Uncharacterized protein n=1 Tax=Peronosclerospora sorghi TaxID=230839 RepID=A0ACC0WIW5_9STRA|nr:hypothetical protein PsorP6_012060 [Peronosclerospora sorghi]